MAPMSAPEIAAVFDRRAVTYDGSDMHRWLAGEAFRIAAPSPGATIVDVAGGTGLASRAHSGPAVVLDLSLGMLAAARGAGAHAVIVGDAHRLPFADSTFERVMCVSALPYLADPRAAAGEWHRVCKPSGRTVVTAWMEDGITLPHRLRQAAAEEGIVVADPNAALGSESRLAGLLESAGFTAIHVHRRTFAAEESDPLLTWTATVDYGFAPALTAAPEPVRDRVRERFLASTRETREASYTALIGIAQY